MSVHYQFCTDIFKFCQTFSDSVATVIVCAAGLQGLQRDFCIQFVADLTDSTPDHQTWLWFDTY